MDFFKSLSHYLFLDIETVCCAPAYEKLGERLQFQWTRKAAILNSEVPADKLFFEKGAIYAEFGKVIAIGVGFFYLNSEKQLSFKVKSFFNDDEEKLLQEFKQLVEKFNADTLILCAHNGKEFDFPYLCRRMLVNGLQIPQVLNCSGKKPWEIKHFDTLDYWKFGDRKNFTSLELLAALFNIPGSKDDIDGSMVSEVYYKEQGLERIARYCSKDVVVTAQLFLRLNHQPIIPKENIVFS